MSLLLRQSCQNVLDGVKLTEYHVRIDDSTKTLVVSSTCGKPLFSIPGIQFASLRPTRVEIDYAVELLDTFVLTHADSITAYLKAYHAFNKLTPVLREDKDSDIKIEGGYYTAKNQTIVYFLDNEFKFKYNSETNYTLFVGAPDSTTAEMVTKFKLDKNKLKAAKKYLADFSSYSNSKQALEDLLNKLATCDI